MLCVLSHFSCVWLCDPMDCSPPGPSVHGIPQARILEWIAMPSSREPPQSRDRTCISYVSCIGRQVLDSQAWRTDLWLPRGREGEEVMDWKFGVSRCKILYIGWINNKVILYSTENNIQYLMTNHSGKEYEENIYIYTCITELLCYTAEIKYNIVNQLYSNKIFFKNLQVAYFWNCPFNVFRLHLTEGN